MWENFWPEISPYKSSRNSRRVGTLQKKYAMFFPIPISLSSLLHNQSRFSSLPSIHIGYMTCDSKYGHKFQARKRPHLEFFLLPFLFRYQRVMEISSGHLGASHQRLQIHKLEETRVLGRVLHSLTSLCKSCHKQEINFFFFSYYMFRAFCCRSISQPCLIPSTL